MVGSFDSFGTTPLQFAIGYLQTILQPLQQNSWLLNHALRGKLTYVSGPFSKLLHPSIMKRSPEINRVFTSNTRHKQWNIHPFWPGSNRRSYYPSGHDTRSRLLILSVQCHCLSYLFFRFLCSHFSVKPKRYWPIPWECYTCFGYSPFISITAFSNSVVLFEHIFDHYTKLRVHSKCLMPITG